jgi:cytidylate kinase
MNMSSIKIAIDGPAGAGKSTIAKFISKKLGLIYLDTGAMYRTVALKAIRLGFDPLDPSQIIPMLANLNIQIEHGDGEQHIFLDGKNVSHDIRTPEVSLGASNVAVIPDVRLAMVKLQREMAQKIDVVMDGRDIGTYVLPNADYKFFLTASTDERAKRRYLELQAKGNTDISFEEVKKDIEYRDKNDSSRAFAPLSKADDAVEVDTTGMSIEQVIEKILSYININR